MSSFCVSAFDWFLGSLRMKLRITPLDREAVDYNSDGEKINDINIGNGRFPIEHEADKYK